MERGRLVCAFRPDGFARTRRPRSMPELHELALPAGSMEQILVSANMNPVYESAADEMSRMWK
jgi:hypothetical protein